MAGTSTEERALLTPQMVNELRPDSFQVHPWATSLEYRDLGLKELTGGKFSATVYRARPGHHEGLPWHQHNLSFQFAFVTKGWAIFEFEGVGQVRLEPGTAIYQLPMNRHREISASEDFEILEVTTPAEFKTIME
ncbi:MAG TPA: cupin domain-containing protein [Candidatus Binataceae bacterium]|nr:cupin domain-containing protein [Candidatus Binataceae bacterium]